MYISPDFAAESPSRLSLSKAFSDFILALARLSGTHALQLTHSVVWVSLAVVVGDHEPRLVLLDSLKPATKIILLQQRCALLVTEERTDQLITILNSADRPIGAKLEARRVSSGSPASARTTHHVVAHDDSYRSREHDLTIEFLQSSWGRLLVLANRERLENRSWTGKGGQQGEARSE